MILHLLHDDKICNRIVSNFSEALKGVNKYVCICDTNHLQYMCEDDTRVILVDSGNGEVDEDVLNDIDTIVIHFLNIDKINFVKRYFPIDSNIKIYWVLWGGDLYEKVLYTRGYDIYYEPQFVYINSIKFKLIDSAVSLLSPQRSFRRIVEQISDFILSRVNYILTTDAESKIIKQYLGCEIQAKCIDRGPIYYPVEDVLGSLMNEYVEGNNIMIGNSASFSNNHLLAMELLSKLDTTARKKYVPLSYGGSPQYIRHIESKGQNFFDSNFCPLKSFMPIEEYNRLMLSCSVFVYCNWRQEAVGNIVIALYLGAKVFVSGKSPLIEYFQSKGIKLYITETMTQYEIDMPEDNKVVEHNRKAIMDLFSKSSILNHIKDIFPAS